MGRRRRFLSQVPARLCPGLPHSPILYPGNRPHPTVVTRKGYDPRVGARRLRSARGWPWGTRGGGAAGGGVGGREGAFPTARAWKAGVALHPLQLGLSEDCLLSFTGKLGALGPWPPDSQPPGSPGRPRSLRVERFSTSPPRRVTVPYCLAGRLSSGGFYKSSVGEGRGCKKPAGLPQTVPDLSNQTCSPKILKGRFQLSN